MTSAEKEIVLRGWEQIDNEAIVKDVATKGKYINLSIGFLSKRMNINYEQTKEYFNDQIDHYVYRLLSNGHVFRAEHVLTNLNRSPKYVFYEFIILTRKNLDSSDTTSDTQQKCEDTIWSYLKKIGGNFEQERFEYDLQLEMLQSIKTDQNLLNKYQEDFKKFTLEELYQKNDHFRHTLATDILFLAKLTFVNPLLNKRAVWEYLLDHKQFLFVVKWLNTLAEHSSLDIQNANLEDNFESNLTRIFANWNVDEQMMHALNSKADTLTESVRNALVRNGLFLNKENDVEQQLNRICVTQSWDVNLSMLATSNFRESLIKLVLDKGFLPLLMQHFVDVKSLQNVRDQYPQHLRAIDLGIALKSYSIDDAMNLSLEVSRFICENDPEFYKDNPLVFLCELLLQNTDVHTILASDETKSILVKVPLLKILLKKWSTAKGHHDQVSTLEGLFSRFQKIDLNAVLAEAGDKDLSFSNKALVSKYGEPEKLGYIYYVKQCRSAFAVYAFFIEQLQQYSQITKGQIMYACGLASDLAFANFENGELVTHCMAFIEMLGINSSQIRAQLKCMRLVKIHNPNLDFLSITESALLKLMENQEFYASHTKNARELDSLRCVYEAYNSKLPDEFLRNVAMNSDWFQLCLFATYYDYTLEQFLQVIDSDAMSISGSNNVAINVATAIKYEVAAERCRRNSSLTYREHRKKIQIKMDINSVSMNGF